MSKRAAKLFAGLTKVVNDLGGDVVRTGVESNLNCPFEDHLGVGWGQKILYVRKGVQVSAPLVSSAIHEAGHIFASNKEPERSDEWEFLGWEIFLATKVLEIPLPEWAEHNKHYVVGDFGVKGKDLYSVGSLTPLQVKILAKNRVAAAKKSGLIKNDKLRTVR